MPPAKGDNMPSDPTNRRARREAGEGVADILCDEMITNLFHDADQKGWIRLPSDDHYETYAIKTREIVRFLQREYWNRMKELYGKGELMDPVVIGARLEYLQARAEFDGPESPVFLRVGDDQRVLYIDLCDEKWRVVRISPDGW